MRFVVCLLGFAALSHVGHCGVHYGPSISTLTGVYANYKKAPDILSLNTGPQVVLQSFPGLSVTLPLASGHPEATSEQIFKERGISTLGEFDVLAPRGYGIIVVIQELKLRKRDYNGTAVCSDYIQFKEPANDRVSEEVCGIARKGDNQSKPKGLVGSRTFKTSSPRLSVSFNHAYVAELVQSLLGSKQKHFLRAEVTFTAFSDCMGLSNSSNAANETLVTCSDYETKKDVVSNNNSVCISSKVFCDEIYNCGGDGESVGSDDSSATCPHLPAQTTETAPLDEPELEIKPGRLANLETYLGIPSLSSYTPRPVERRFRTSYVSGTSSSGFLHDFSATRKPKKVEGKSSITEPSPLGGSIEIAVVGPSGKDAKAGNANSNPLYSTSTVEGKGKSEAEMSDIYSRRELAHAINSVIYGVAVFIIFTIFITVFVVCLTKKVQTIWIAREERRASVATMSSRRVSTPGILPPHQIVTLSLPEESSGSSRRSSAVSASECAASSRATSRSPSVVVVEDFGDFEQLDPPPAYESLFPSRE